MYECGILDERIKGKMSTRHGITQEGSWKSLNTELCRLGMSEEKKECVNLLTGGYDVFEVKDMEEFGDRIETIQDAYRAVVSTHTQHGKDSNINIQDEWRGYVG